MTKSNSAKPIPGILFQTGKLVLAILLFVGALFSEEIVLGKQFSNPSPYEYYSYRHVLRTGQIKKDFKPTFPDKLFHVADFNPGTPVLGRSFANLTVNADKDELTITARVLDEEGKELTRVLTKQTGKLKIPYLVPVTAERLKLETRIERDGQPDVIVWPIKVPFAHRLYLDRNRHWAGDVSLGATLKFHLSPGLLSRAKVSVRLLQDGKIISESVFEKLPADKRIVFFKLASQKLKPGKYEVVSDLAGAGIKSKSRQWLEILKAPRPAIVKVPLRVEEIKGLQRESVPVAGGIPFPDGILRVEDAGRLRVVDSKGKPAAAQGRVLATWGPNREWVKWLFITTKVTTASGETSKYELQAGPKVKARKVRRSLSIVTKDEGNIVVDTGRVKFECRPGGGVFGQLWLDGKAMLKGPARLKLVHIPRFTSQAGLLTSNGSGSATVDPIDPGLTAIAFPPVLDFKPGVPPDGQWKEWLNSTEGWKEIDTRGLIWARNEVGDIDRQGLKVGCYRALFNVSETLSRIPELWLRVKAGAGDKVSLVLDGNPLSGTHLIKDSNHSIRISIKGFTPGQHQLGIVVHAGSPSAGLVSPLSIRVSDNLDTASLAQLRSEAEETAQTLWGRTTSIQIVDAGPLRAEICLRGFFGPGKEHAERIVRIIAHAGSPSLDISTTWVNRRDPEEFVIGDLSLVLPLSDLNGAAIEFDGKPILLKQGGHVWQSGTQSCRAGKIEGKRWGGWSSAGGVLLALRKHWQNFPTGFEVDRNSNAVLHLWDGAGERALDISTARTPERWRRHPKKIGIAKTWRFSLQPHDQNMSGDEATQRSSELLQPLLLTADPKWVCDSDASGPLQPYDANRFPDCERAFHDLFEGVELQQQQYDIYGILDYGDFHSQWSRRKPEEDPNLEYRKGWDWYRYWMNNETTGTSSTFYLWLQYLRTMKRRYFDLVADRSRHLMDVDTCHFSPDMPARADVEYSAADIVGCQYNHDFYHWSGWPKVHHTKADDILLYYYLTGDGRALDVAKEMQGMMKVMKQGAFGGGSIRVLSVPGRLAFNLYRHFWDAELLQYSRDSWETMRAFCGAGDRAYITYAKYHRYTGDERFLREWLMTDVVNENKPLAPLDRLIEKQFGPEKIHYSRNNSTNSTFGYFATRSPLTLLPLAKGFYSQGSEYSRSNVTYDLRSGSDSELYGTGSFPDAIPNNGKERKPVGYGWMRWGGFKHAYTLRALVEGGMIRSKPAGPISAVKGKTGNWSEPATWEGDRPPRPDDSVLIPEGTTIVYDGPTNTSPTCRAITIEGRLRFAPGKHTLLPQGDITVSGKGILEMGPGSALLFDCNFSGEFGLNVEPDSLIRFKGTSPEQRDCKIGALRADGFHNTYIRLAGQKATGIIENCELFSLGVGDVNAERVDHNRKLGLVFESVHQYNYIRLTGNEIHHCLVGLFLNKSGPPLHREKEVIANNVIRDCNVGMMLFWTLNRVTISGNRIDNNKVGISLQGSQGEPGGAFITKNSLRQNGIGLHVLYRGGTGVKIQENSYTNNDIAILFDKPATVKNETISGGRIGVKLGNDSRGSQLIQCRIGTDHPTKKADIMVESEKSSLTLQGCRFGNKKNIIAHPRGIHEAPPEPGLE